ncbi:MAG: hypothetical protein JWO36_352 [Myxococcales bacterium]|nr:hypothetical protein [Myxococcales bacterium]
MGYVRTRKDPKLDLRHRETLYPPDERGFRDSREDAARELSHDDKVTNGVLASGTSLELVGGLAATVVSVIGLSSYLPFYMCAVATIAIGVAFLAHGLSVIARWEHAARRLAGSRYDRGEVIGGVSTEVFGGTVGLILGVLALSHVLPFVLMPVAAIVYGGSLLLGGAAQPELVELVPQSDPRYRRITRDAIQASAGVMVLVGIAAATLGILALLAVGPVVVLTLSAMLSIGGALVIAGGALTARFVQRAV